MQQSITSIDTLPVWIEKSRDERNPARIKYKVYGASKYAIKEAVAEILDEVAEQGGCGSFSAPGWDGENHFVLGEVILPRERAHEPH